MSKKTSWMDNVFHGIGRVIVTGILLAILFNAFVAGDIRVSYVKKGGGFVAGVSDVVDSVVSVARYIPSF